MNRKVVIELKVEIINTGTELLTGDTRNDNAVFLAGVLLRHGIRVWRQTTVGDYPPVLKETIARALQESDIIIITGGLGPTKDDITKETVAEVMGLPLYLHEESLWRIKNFFQARNRSMPEPNIKQAMVPETSVVLNNDHGTAPGIILEKDRKLVVILPGPPLELGPMFEKYALEQLRGKGLIGNRPVAGRIVKLWGIGESLVQEKLADLHWPESKVEIAYQFRRGEVWVKLNNKVDPADEKPLEERADLIRQRLGEYVFGHEGDSMESVVAKLLLDNKLTISLAESCTGGLIAKKLTDLPGSSSYLMYGVVSYSNQAKEKILGVRPETLEKFGAVSEETALEMVNGVRTILNTHLAVSVTGIAGPDGGTREKPLGLVYIAVAGEKGSYCKKHLFYGDRENIREMSARAALNMVRLYITGLL